MRRESRPVVSRGDELGSCSHIPSTAERSAVRDAPSPSQGADPDVACVISLLPLQNPSAPPEPLFPVAGTKDGERTAEVNGAAEMAEPNGSEAPAVPNGTTARNPCSASRRPLCFFAFGAGAPRHRLRVPSGFCSGGRISHGLTPVRLCWFGMVISQGQGVRWI